MKHSHSRIKDLNDICDSKGFSKLILTNCFVGLLLTLLVGISLSKFIRPYAYKPLVDFAIVLTVNFWAVGPTTKILTEGDDEFFN